MYCSRTLQLYILRETLKVFILAAVAVNLIMNFAAILTFLHRLPLPIIPLIKVVLLRMPQLFPWTFPMALLLAVTLIYGRMASDNEVMAMQASGIHMLWILLPGLMLGVLLSMGLFLVNDRLLPYCRVKEYQLRCTEAVNMLPEIFRSRRSFDFKKFQLTWEDARENTIFGLSVTQRNPEGVVTMRCKAESATYCLLPSVNQETQQTSYQLQLQGHNVSGETFRGTVRAATFVLEEKYLTIPLTDIEPRDPGVKAKSILELYAYLDTLKTETRQNNRELDQELKGLKDKTEEKVKRLGERLTEPGMDKEKQVRIQQQIAKLKKGLDRKQEEVDRRTKSNSENMKREKNDVLTTIHLRLSLAMSGLALVMVGIPLGILSGREHMLKAFVLACVPVVVVYYPLLLLGRNLAEARAVSEATALWGPTLLQMGIGAGLMGYLFRR